MGDRGPVPKRSEERRRRNATNSEGVPNEAEVVEVEGEAPKPARAAEDDWHAIATEIWDSAQGSPMSTYYEATDWAILRLGCEATSRLLDPQPIKTSDADGNETVEMYVMPIKGADLTAITKVFGSLMMTEGDRRRMAFEVKRAAAPAAAAPAASQIVASRGGLGVVKN